MKLRHKKSNQENFPVGSLLIKKQYRPLVMDYYRFARYADDVADNPKLSMKEKIRQLDELEDLLYERIVYKGKKLAFVKKIRKQFVKENLSFSLLTDLLTAFRQDAKDYKYETWNQLAEYCKYSAAPVGRFMLAIHNESPSTYLPATSLCVALQVLNHLQDIKYDAKLLKRVYIPSELMKKFGVKRSDLVKDQETPELRKLILTLLKKIKGLLKEAEILPSIIQSTRLRMEVGVILSLTTSMVKGIERDDILKHEVVLSKTDWICAFINGILKVFFTKTKTLTTKGL